MEVLILVGALVAVAWGALLLWRGGPLAGCAMVLAAGTCFGHAFYHLATGAIPLTADRALWALVMAQFVVWYRFGWVNHRSWRTADVVTGLFFAWLLVSCLTHDWRDSGYQALARLVFFYVMPLGLYVVASRSLQPRQGTAVAQVCLALFGMYLAFTAIAETRQWTALVLPEYIASPEFEEFLGRGRGPFLNPVANGFAMNICLCAILLLWPSSHLGRLVAMAIVGLLAIGIYYTLTRSVWMGTALSLTIVGAEIIPRRWRLPLIGGVVALGAVLVVVQWNNLVAFKRDKGLSSEETEASVKLRPVLARIAWNMFVDRPLVGCGFGQYARENVDYLNDRTTDLPLAVGRPFVQHNVWLNVLVETGLVGLTLFCAMLWLWGRDAWRVFRSPGVPLRVRRQALLFVAILGAYLPNGMFHDMALVPMVNMFFFFFAGWTEGLSIPTPQPQTGSRRLPNEESPRMLQPV
ncbi:MAG TPA: O-antigen ligase family protein [Pirellulales bacterium]|jgi:O-antigen ligase|nr:O-antigen ligase family protein [Pirellulales bacterium]